MTNKFLRMAFVIAVAVSQSLIANAYERKSINVRVNGTSRNMVVFTPENITPDLPLMIVTHGMNQNPEYQMDADRMYELVDSERFVIAYLRSNGQTWDVGSTADQKFVEQSIVEMYTRYDIDPHRVYWMGFSMGSMLMYHSMANMQGKIAAFAPTSGVQFSEQPWDRCRKPVNLIHCHAYGDDVFGYEKYSIHNYVENMAKMNGYTDYNKIANYRHEGSEITGDLETWTNSSGNVVRMYSYNNGGHWPTRNNRKLIWDFCKQFSIADADLDPIQKGEKPGGIYSVDKTSELTANASMLDGRTLLVTDEGCNAVWYANSELESPQNVRIGSMDGFENNPYCFLTFHKVASAGCATGGNLYTIQVADRWGSNYSIWNTAGYLNTPPGAWCLFALGITDHKYGQDADYCGLWKVDYVDGLGYTIQNVGVSEANGGGAYISPTSEVPVADKRYMRFFSKVAYKAPTTVERTESMAKADGGVYDLSGRRVRTTKPGRVYVANGHKFVSVK